MGKRFTDTEKWKDPWFRRLSAKMKVVWEYLRDNCDNAGFWKVDIDYAVFHVGEQFSREEVFAALNNGKTRLRDHCHYWEICDFVEFQFGHLTPDCKPHRPVIDLIEKYKRKGYGKGIDTLEEKEKEKEKEEGGVGETKKWFDELWKQYPNKTGKSRAIERFRRSVKTVGNLQEIREALKRYLRHLQVNTWKSAQNGSTWFNSWRDWVIFEESEKADKDGLDPRQRELLEKGKRL